MTKALTQEEINKWSDDEIDEKWPHIWGSSVYNKNGGVAYMKLTLEAQEDTNMMAKWDSKRGFIATKESIIEDLFYRLFSGLPNETIKQIHKWLWEEHANFEEELTDEERKISKANNLPYQIELTMPEVKS